MEIVRFVIRRLRAQRALGVGIVVTLAFAIAAISSAPIFIDGARSAIYQSAFANASEPVRDIRLSLFAKPTDWAKSDQHVRSAISDVPTDAVVAQGLASARLSDYTGQLILMFRDGAADHLTFTKGRAPRDGEVAIPSGLVFADGPRGRGRASRTGSLRRDGPAEDRRDLRAPASNGPVLLRGGLAVLDRRRARPRLVDRPRPWSRPVRPRWTSPGGSACRRRSRGISICLGIG